MADSNTQGDSSPVDASAPSIGVHPPSAILTQDANQTSTEAHASSTSSIASASNTVKKSAWINPDDKDSGGKHRLNRTCRILLTKGGKDYSRESFKDRIEFTVGLNALEACGPTAAPHIWQLTFTSTSAKTDFEAAGDFTINGEPAKILSPRFYPGSKRTRFYIKVHWVPYHIHMTTALRELEKTEGIKILSADYDQCRTPGMQHVRTTVRTVCIETEDVNLIPFYLKWGNKQEHGTALVTMRDRPPKCLKCDEVGHVRKDCKAIKCTKCGSFGHTDTSCTTPRLLSRIVAPHAAAERAAEGDLLIEDDDSIALHTAVTEQSVTAINSLDTLDITSAEPQHSNSVNSTDRDGNLTARQETNTQPTADLDITKDDLMHTAVSSKEPASSAAVTATEPEAASQLALKLDDSSVEREREDFTYHSFDSVPASTYDSGSDNAIDLLSEEDRTHKKSGAKRVSRDSFEEGSPATDSRPNPRKPKKKKKVRQPTF